MKPEEKKGHVTLTPIWIGLGQPALCPKATKPLDN